MPQLYLSGTSEPAGYDWIPCQLTMSTYIYIKDLAVNNLQWWYAIKPNQMKSYIFNIYG